VDTSELTLARRGFRDGARAASILAGLPDIPADVVDRIAAAASPDVALDALNELAGVLGERQLWTAMQDEDLRERMILVLGTSEALGDFLVRHPDAVDELRTLSEKPLTLDQFRRRMEAADDADALRVAYRRSLLGIAARDLDGRTTFAESSAELADLAMATLGGALRIARLDEPNADACRLGIIAMGKTGGRELNYCSDVDVIFIYEPVDGHDPEIAVQAATRLAAATMRLCGEHTAEGVIWDVDANLRPEGRDGALVRTLSGHVSYYERWASTWEFQALLKARHAAGDEDLVDAYLAAVAPMVWSVSSKPDFVASTRAMRQRVVDNIAVQHRDRQLKLGVGGLRDVEFAVQLLQLVHGRADEKLRSSNTLDALTALMNGGYVGRRDGAVLEEAYEFLRTLEHRIQLFRLRRTHLVPTDEEDLRRIGRSMGFRQRSAELLEREWQAERRVVRSLHEKIFYRPLLEAVASIPTEGLRLTPDEAGERLAALGFDDPAGALANIRALTGGVSRRASIQRQLLPVVLEWLADSPGPDAGLLAFRRVSEDLGDTTWYLRKLRDEGGGAEQLAQILGSSRYVTDLILRGPDAVGMLGETDELEPRDLARLIGEMRMTFERQRPGGAVRAIRRLRRRELTRIGMADVLGRLDIDGVGLALSNVSEATLQTAFEAAVKEVEDELGGSLPTRMAVVLMGRLGGYEAGYASDADVLFVHHPQGDEDAAAKAATAVATKLRTMLSAPSADPPLDVDADLRPDGKSGPLVRTLAAYGSYYRQFSAVWEAQALLRARAAVGDPDLCERFTALIDPIRWPADGVGDAEVKEIRRIKARVDAERLPRGADPNTHFKLGRGGLADVEWTVQLLQLQHAAGVPELRTTRTVAALHAAAAADLMTAGDAAALADAWHFVSRARNAAFLVRGKAAESMPDQPRERAGVAALLGYGLGDSSRMVDDYLRVTRRARRVVERLFY
jgi:glutamate-ammonia-ligase adenylyltransferase